MRRRLIETTENHPLCTHTAKALMSGIIHTQKEQKTPSYPGRSCLRDRHSDQVLDVMRRQSSAAICGGCTEQEE